MRQVPWDGKLPVDEGPKGPRYSTASAITSKNWVPSGFGVVCALTEEGRYFPVRVATKNMTTIGLLVGISVVLTRFLGVMVPFAGIQALRLSLGSIPVMLSGILLGPAAGALTGALADLIGAILFPIGPYFPGFTLSAAMSGLIPVTVLRLFPKGEDGFWPLLLATFVRGLVVSTLNTLWLAILSNKAMWVLLPPRLLGSILQVPIYALVLYYIMKGLRAYRRSLVSQEAR